MPVKIQEQGAKINILNLLRQKISIEQKLKNK